jgi:proteasome activator subunit 4
MEDSLKGRKKQLRPMLIERLQLQHERRVMEAQMSAITEVHLQILKDLLALSTSSYTEVRCKCQSLLSDALFAFRHSNRLLLPLLLDKLQHKDSVSHEQLKGSLYILQSEKCLYLSHCYWDTISLIWPAIVQADHSEKSSISTLMSNLVKRIMEKFNSPAIQWIVPTAIVDMGVTIASGAGVSLSENELSDGAAHLKERNKQTDQMYENLVAQLMSLAESDKLHWRFTEFAVHFLVPLIRHDRLLPTAAVGFFVHSLNHETLAVRKVCNYYSRTSLFFRCRQAHNAMMQQLIKGWLLSTKIYMSGDTQKVCATVKILCLLPRGEHLLSTFNSTYA